MGQTTDTMKALMAHAQTQFTNSFDGYFITQRNPFEAVEAGMLDRCGTAFLLSRRSDNEGARGGGGQRALTILQPVITVMVALTGRTVDGSATEQARTYLLFDLCDTVASAFEVGSIATSPETTFAGIQVDPLIDSIDTAGNYIFTEIPLSVTLKRI